MSSGGCRGLAKVDRMWTEKRKVRNGEEETLGERPGGDLFEWKPL